MDDDEIQSRRAEIVRAVKQQQHVSGHSSPIPSFLNTITDMLIDIEQRVTRLERLVEKDRDGS